MIKISRERAEAAQNAPRKNQTRRNTTIKNKRKLALLPLLIVALVSAFALMGGCTGWQDDSGRRTSVPGGDYSIDDDFGDEVISRSVD